MLINMPKGGRAMVINMPKGVRAMLIHMLDGAARIGALIDRACGHPRASRGSVPPLAKVVVPGTRQPAPSLEMHHGPRGSLSGFAQPLPVYVTPFERAVHSSRHVQGPLGGAGGGLGGGGAVATGGEGDAADPSDLVP